MKRSLFGIARNFNQANTLVGRLQEVGFPIAEISVLAPEVAGVPRLEGNLRLLTEIGPLVGPGWGPLIAAGPMKAVLSNDMRLEEAFTAVGVPEIEAAVYEEKLRQGNYLLAVFANENRDVERARETFRNSGAEDLCVSEEGIVSTVNR